MLFGQSVGQYDSRRVHCATRLTEEASDQSVTSFPKGEEYPTVFINMLGVEPCIDWRSSGSSKRSNNKPAMQRLETETRLVDGRIRTPDEVAKTSSKTWTLPTHSVTNPNKP